MALIAGSSDRQTRRGTDYVFGPDVGLRVEGAALAARHFAREFGPGTPAPHTPDVVVELCFGHPRGRGTRFVAGGYKTAHWRIALSPPDQHPLSARIYLTGGPASFALSLVQGWFVEPLVAVALARRGQVALPSAGLESRFGALILMGSSGSGKSSLVLRALAAGRRVMSDDQVILDVTGRCWPVPRRLRVYSDMRETAPGAWGRLEPATRRALVARRAARTLSGGFVAPSLAISPTEVGRELVGGPVPAGRLVVIERGAGNGELVSDAADPAWTAACARRILAEQRERFLLLAGVEWHDALAAVADQEIATLRSAIADIRTERVRLPGTWDAARAIAALEDYLTPLLA